VAIRKILDVLGLQNFVKSQPFGLETLIHPEGKAISFSITKKLILARALLHQPKCLILEDPLDIYTSGETQEIIDYLCLEKQPWSIVVVSNNSYWDAKCDKIIELSQGKIQVLKK
jgi:ABC-type transport system involved in cytochrome bd biosynthesis fused ATPase/permease subunit